MRVNPLIERPAFARAQLCVLICLMALSFLAVPTVNAQPDTETPAAITLEPRAIPDYDGRGDEPTTTNDVLLWIPRVLMSPLYVLTEYGLRQPLRYVVSGVEEVQIAEQVLEFFRFGPDDRFMLSPTFTLDFGLRSNIGIIFSVDDAFVDDNRIRLSYAFGGSRWHLASFEDRYQWDDGQWQAGLRSLFQSRPDGLFWGEGDEIQEAANSGFSYISWDTEVYLEQAIGAGMFRAETGIRYRDFSEDTGNTDIPNVSQVVSQGVLSGLPPGYEDGYTIHYIGAELKLDSRPARLDGRRSTTTRLPHPEPATGFVASADVEFAYSLRDPSALFWLKYGGGLRMDLDVSGANHIISLAIGAHLTESKGQIPFTERPTLSGGGPMAGFLGDYLVGKSAINASLSYSWPIWVFLDGVAHLTVGNVFDGMFERFALDQLRMSATVGIAAVVRRDYFFEFLIGFGTDTFANGGDIESFRLTLGGHRDF